MTETRRLDAAALDILFLKARSYNAWLPRPVNVAMPRRIWDLARMGPTSANISPARMVWCVSDEAKAILAAAASSTNARKILQAPVTDIIGMDYDFADKLPFLFPHADARPWFVHSDEAVATNAMRNATLQGA